MHNAKINQATGDVYIYRILWEWKGTVFDFHHPFVLQTCMSLAFPMHGMGRKCL
jgi:hypothetical protein